MDAIEGRRGLEGGCVFELVYESELAHEVAHGTRHSIAEGVGLFICLVAPRALAAMDNGLVVLAARLPADARDEEL